MSFKGLDQFTRKLDEFGKAVAALDGEITNVEFDPYDPQSIEAAIQQMETAIDERAGDHRNNNMIKGVVVEIKEHFRQSILEKAASERTG